MIKLANLFRTIALSLVILSISGCQPNVYGSVGVSSFGGYRGSPGYHGNPGMHGSVRVGGRICC